MLGGGTPIKWGLFCPWVESGKFGEDNNMGNWEQSIRVSAKWVRGEQPFQNKQSLQPSPNGVKINYSINLTEYTVFHRTTSVDAPRVPGKKAWEIQNEEDRLKYLPDRP